jgi:hypothetical protein
VQIKASLAGKINLADFQRAIPVVRELTLNLGSRTRLEMAWLDATKSTPRNVDAQD